MSVINLGSCRVGEDKYHKGYNVKGTSSPFPEFNALNLSLPLPALSISQQNLQKFTINDPFKTHLVLLDNSRVIHGSLEQKYALSSLSAAAACEAAEASPGPLHKK